jgi:vacuolar-type H+-ATPase subunit F/Vma7
VSRIAVLGESPRVDGWALAGAVVVPAAGSEAVQRAWDGLPGDVEVVIVTPAAAGELGDRTNSRLVVVLP